MANGPRFAGKIVLVTGGSSGLGLAAARAFADEDADVIIAGRDQASIDRAVGAIGTKATGYHADISRVREIEQLMRAVRTRYGRLDVLFANAGGGSFVPLGSITEEHYDQMFNTNVKGVLFTVQKALPLIPDGGSIILNASVVSIKGYGGSSVYSATKAAVRSFARTWTSDLKDRKIRVNVISPGPIDTPIFDGLGETEEERAAVKAGFVAGVPLGRIGQADEIGKAAVFLASDDASYVAGVELFVDGGQAQV